MMRAELARWLRESAAGQRFLPWFLEQSPRDRRMLAALGVFLALVTLYVAVWDPIRSARAEAEQRYASELADYRWLLEHREAARAAASRRGGGGGRGQALLGTVAGSARRNGIDLSRFQPEGEQALSIVLEDVSFNELLRWLERLSTQHGIRVRQATIDSRARDGRVSGRIVVF